MFTLSTQSHTDSPSVSVSMKCGAGIKLGFRHVDVSENCILNEETFKVENFF